MTDTALKSMYVLLLAGLVALVFAAAPAPAAAQLAGSAWTAREVNGDPVPDGLPVFLRFAEDGASGAGGCNRFTGGYAESGEALALGPFAATRMACTGPAMDVEAAFFDALQATRSYRRDAAGLELLDEDGEVLAAFAARPYE